jgi:hypothetical protein
MPTPCNFALIAARRWLVFESTHATASPRTITPKIPTKYTAVMKRTAATPAANSPAIAHQRVLVNSDRTTTQMKIPNEQAAAKSRRKSKRSPAKLKRLWVAMSSPRARNARSDRAVVRRTVGLQHRRIDYAVPGEATMIPFFPFRRCAPVEEIERALHPFGAQQPAHDDPPTAAMCPTGTAVARTISGMVPAVSGFAPLFLVC